MSDTTPQYQDPHNGQYGSTPLFGLDSSAYASTGAEGSPGSQASATAGPVVGSPDVTAVYQSVQGAAPASVPVHSGDTSGFSDDVPVHASPLLPGSPDSYMQTGAGMGSDITAGHHPNARS